MARGDKTLAIQVRIDEELNDEVKRAAKEHGWSTSEEIRRRLKAVGTGDVLPEADEPTKALLAEIVKIAGQVQDAYGVAWHEAGPIDVNLLFVRAVQEMMNWACFAGELTHMEGEAAPKPRPGSIIDRLSAPIDPLDNKKLAQVIGGAAGRNVSVW